MKRGERPIPIRPADPRDAESLARLHFTCSHAQPGGFMHRLGPRFFLAYYRILLREPTTVILVADAGRDGVLGFVSATLDSKRQLEAIRRRRLGLLVAAIPALIRTPGLLWDVYLRNRSLSPGAMGEGFGISSGARIAYWGWLPTHPSHGQATLLIREVLRTLASLGASTVRLETDRVNRKVEVMHRLLGARVVESLVTRDGRERIVFEYALGPTAGQAPAR